MSYDVSLESMLIPDVGNGYPEELAALEDWIINMESQLIAEDISYLAAMEAEGAEAGGASPSSFVTRIRTAFDKLRSGKKKGDDAAVSAAAQEIQEASDEFNEEANAEQDPDKKKKWKKAAAIIAAIVAAVALALGARAIAKNAKSKAATGNVAPSDAANMAKKAAEDVKKADPSQVAAPEDKPALPAHQGSDALPGRQEQAAIGGREERLALPPGPKGREAQLQPGGPLPPTAGPSKRYSEEQLAADRARRGTGASKVNPDGSTERILSRSERKEAGRDKAFGTPNPNGNRAQRRAGGKAAPETPLEKKARLLREAAQQKVANGGHVSAEDARRIQNTEKKINRQATANAHAIIAQANQLRGEQKRSGATPAPAPAENQGEIKELLAQVNGHFAKMKESGGLKVKQTGSSTFYKRTKQGDQAKVYKKEINGMAQAIARLTQLGYNGDAINMYNQLKKAQH